MANVESGELETRISFYKISDDVDKSRITDESDFVLLRTCWANVRTITAREQIRNGLEIQDHTFTVLCRYFSGLSTATCRMKMNDLWYFITSIESNKRDNRMILSVALDSRLNQNEDITT